MQKAIHN